jgi:arylsulfatase A-like enzyme
MIGSPLRSGCPPPSPSMGRLRTASALMLCPRAVIDGVFVREEAAAASPPNILIFVTDDHRDGLEVMPKTVAWLGKGGTRYANAFATTPLCCPSRASIFSGRYAHNHGVTSNEDPRHLNQQTTMQYHLDQAGYRTGIFGKYLNSWLHQRPPHFDRWAIFGKAATAYSGGEWNVQGTIQTVSQYATHFIGDKAQTFLNSASTQPWFLYLAPPNPHVPYTAEAKYKSAPVPPWNCNPAVMESDCSDKPPYVRLFNRSCSKGKDDRVKQLRTLMSVDDLVDRVLRTVQAKGELGNTLVFFLSDNGSLWSEHGLGGKRHAYLKSIQIPMLARWTGHIPAGAVDRRLVANIDVAPTVLDAVGLTPTIPMDGHSLLSGYKRNRILTEYWSGGTWAGPVEGDPVPDWASLYKLTGEFIRYYKPDGTVSFREYYDLKADPWQLSNLYNPPAGWEAQLTADRRCAGASCP